MKRKMLWAMMIVAMVALGGCGNAEEPINDTNPIATPVVTETTKNETVTNKETPVPTEKVEPTAEPVIEPAEEELTWENILEEFDDCEETLLEIIRFSYRMKMSKEMEE